LQTADTGATETIAATGEAEGCVEVVALEAAEACTETGAAAEAASGETGQAGFVCGEHCSGKADFTSEYAGDNHTASAIQSAVGVSAVDAAIIYRWGDTVAIAQTIACGAGNAGRQLINAGARETRKRA
jgi:hypothetical protein